MIARILTLTTCLTLFAAPAFAADTAAKETTLTGRLACSLCVLKDPAAKTCSNVLVVPAAGKEVIYALADNPVAKAYSMKACSAALPVKVTGTVKEGAGRPTLTPTKIEKT
jgi:hypothetical protein